MNAASSLASYQKAYAVSFLNRLFILAEGEKPTPCHKVWIEPIRMPNTYEIYWATEFGIVCPQQVTRYECVYHGLYRGERSVTLISADGPTQLNVVQAPDGEARTQVRDRTTSTAPSVQGLDVPVPFLAGGGDFPVPFRMGNITFQFGNALKSGNPEEVSCVISDRGRWETATGYSANYRFDEALQDALANLPDQSNHAPDEIWFIDVVHAYVEVGGFVGIPRLAVTVATHSPENSRVASVD